MCVWKECWDCKEATREGRDWLTIFTQPSHELEQKVSLPTRFQCTANTSRLCSCHDWTGNSSRPMSKSLIEPSPAAITSWFSCVSDHERSYSASCVSNLNPRKHIRRNGQGNVDQDHFSTTMPSGDKPRM